MLKRVQLFKPRASGLFNIMTDPRAKSEVLSDGAKTYLDKCAKELFYGYTADSSSKYTEKGIEVEEQSIELFNSVFFTNHAKNTKRRETDYLTGEPDIFTGAEIIDIKSSWSLDTFPASARAGDKKEYEWQMRASCIYSMLKKQPSHIAWLTRQSTSSATKTRNFTSSHTSCLQSFASPV